MSFFTIPITIRVTEHTKAMIEELLLEMPDKFEDVSNVIRVGILQLHRRELPNSKLRGEYEIYHLKDEED